MSFERWWANKRMIRCDGELRVHVDEARALAREAYQAGAEESASGRNMLTDLQLGRREVINELRELHGMVLKTEGDFVSAGLSCNPICEYRYILDGVVRRLEKRFLA